MSRRITSHVQNMHSYVEKIAGKTITNIISNTVQTGVIQSSEAGYYNVALSAGNDSELVRATAMNTKDKFVVNDYVYLFTAKMADGQTSKTSYFIFGLVSATDQKINLLTDYERFILDETAFTYKSENDVLYYPEEEAHSKIIYTIDKTDTVNGGAALFQAILVGQKALLLQGTFSAGSLPVGGKIGLQLDFYQGSILLNTYKLNEEYFLGQPYKIQNSEQKRVITIQENDKQADKIQIKFYSDAIDSSVSNIILQAGELKNNLTNLKVNIKLDGVKNYIGKNENFIDSKDDSFNIKAEVDYDGQILDSASIKYFWAIKDDSVTDNRHANYNALFGIGWKCLNTYEYAKITVDDEVVEDPSLKIWDTKNSTITINNGNEIFTKYENNIKCVVSYMLTHVESNLINIYNFNYENYNAFLSADKSLLNIVSSNETITLTCSVSNDNVMSNKNVDYIYKWFKNTSLTADSRYTNNFIIIKDNGASDDVNEYEISSSDENQQVSWRCEVYIKQSDGREEKVAETNSITVSSYVDTTLNIYTENIYRSYYYSLQSAVIEEVQKQVYVKAEQYIDGNEYYIQQKIGSNVSYEKVENPIQDNIDNYYSKIFYTSWKVNGSETATVTYTSKDAIIDTNNIKNALRTLNVSKNDVYYIYYSFQTKTYRMNQDEKQYITIGHFSKPQIIQQIKVNDVIGQDISFEVLKTEEQLSALNTFNALTNSGQEQGFYYDDSQVDYIKVSNDNLDWENEKYFYKESLSNIYIPLTETQYNEMSIKPVLYKAGQHLFINAEYIKTGTLQIGKDTTEKFYASIDEEEVRIAGWKVESDKLTSASEEIILSTGTLINGENLIIKATDNCKIFTDGTIKMGGSSTTLGHNFQILPNGTVQMSLNAYGYNFYTDINGNIKMGLADKNNNYHFQILSTGIVQIGKVLNGYNFETFDNGSIQMGGENFKVSENREISMGKVEENYHFRIFEEDDDFSQDGGKITYICLGYNGNNDPNIKDSEKYNLTLNTKEQALNLIGTFSGRSLNIQNDGEPSIINCLRVKELTAFSVDNKGINKNILQISSNGILLEDAETEAGESFKICSPWEDKYLCYAKQIIKDDDNKQSVDLFKITYQAYIRNCQDNEHNSYWFPTFETALFIKDFIFCKDAFDQLLNKATADVSWSKEDYCTIDFYLNGGGLYKAHLTNTFTFTFNWLNTDKILSVNIKNNGNTAIETNFSFKLTLNNDNTVNISLKYGNNTEFILINESVSKTSESTINFVELANSMRFQDEGTYQYYTFSNNTQYFDVNLPLATIFSAGYTYYWPSIAPVIRLNLPTRGYTDNWMASFGNGWIYSKDGNKYVQLGETGISTTLNTEKIQIVLKSTAPIDTSAVNATTYNNNSDIKLKHNILPLSTSISSLFDSLQPVQYIFNTKNVIDFGFIAQDVQNALEKNGFKSDEYGLVSQNGEYLSLNYIDFIALCVNEIQKLKKEIKEIKGELRNDT